MSHYIVNHKQTPKDGFVWVLWLDHEDDRNIPIGQWRTVEVSTETADG